MAIGDVTFKSSITPEIKFNIFATPGPNEVLLFLKPEFNIELVGSSEHYAPYGIPTVNYFSIIVAGFLILLLFLFLKK